MYTYRYDETTGGIVLLDDDTVMHSNEPRPVYAREMDFIGMDRHWTYDRQMEIPYLWAEAGTYWYRGTIIAKVKGGALYEAPVLEPFCKVEEAREVQAVPDGTELLPVDLPGMIEQNRMRLSLLEQMTAKRIYNYYKAQLKKELRLFHVAFSGGKDSLVLLDLVRRSLPKTDYMVVFGDTGMEFPDTYEVVDAYLRFTGPNRSLIPWTVGRSSGRRPGSCGGAAPSTRPRRKPWRSGDAAARRTRSTATSARILWGCGSMRASTARAMTSRMWERSSGDSTPRIPSWSGAPPRSGCTFTPIT